MKYINILENIKKKNKKNRLEFREKKLKNYASWSLFLKIRDSWTGSPRRIFFKINDFWKGHFLKSTIMVRVVVY